MRQPIPFGKYLLLDRVSVGGMAEIFKAKSYGVEGFEKVIAIKRILPSMGEDRDFIKMFIDEAKIVGQLAHANICQIFELGRIDGHHFIAMEYIWGKDLLQIQNRLKKIGREMDVPMACYVMAKVCEGLDYAHKKRDAMGRPLEIVHRDCSPQNVLVSYEGECKIIDFGIAKAASRSSRTMAGVLKGKFGYMSPEQVRGLPLDRRSDIFALGTMFYECLVGGRLFQGESDFSTLEKVRNVDIHPPRAQNDQIPEEIEKIVMKALAPSPDDRYQWCSEMHADLQGYLMRQERVFTAKMLGAWLKQAFAQELARERKQMESYRKVGRDGLIAGVPQADAKLDVVEHMGEAGSTDDPTVLGGPSFEDILDEAQRSGGLMPSGKAGGDGFDDGPTRLDGMDDLDDDDSRDFSDEAPTEIYGEGDADINAILELGNAKPVAPGGDNGARQLANARTQLGAGAPDAVRAQFDQIPRRPSLPLMAPSPDQSGPVRQPDTGAFSGAAGAPGMGGMSGMGQPGMAGRGAPETGRFGGGPGMPPGSMPLRTDDMYFGTTSSVRPLPIPGVPEGGGVTAARPKPSIVKDIAIGVAIALFVLGIFAAVKYLYLDRRAKPKPKPKPAALLIGVDEGPAAEVRLGGEKVGEIAGGAEIELPLEFGDYEVELVREGVAPCRHTVSLTADNNRPRLRCQLAGTPKSMPMGKLVLEALEPEWEVVIDGDEIADPSAPILLTAGDDHEVVIKAPDPKAPDTASTLNSFKIKLDPDGVVTRSAKPSPGSEGAEDDDDADDDEGGDGSDDEDAKQSAADPSDRASRSHTARAPKADPVGYLRANTTPPAKILINGKDIGKTSSPKTKVPLKPGKYQVTFVIGTKQYKYPVTITEGEVTVLIKSLAR